MLSLLLSAHFQEVEFSPIKFLFKDGWGKLKVTNDFDEEEKIKCM